MTLEAFDHVTLGRFMACNARLQSWSFNLFIMARLVSVLRAEMQHSYEGVTSLIERLAQVFDVFEESHACLANPEHPEYHGAHVDEETVQLLLNNAGAYGGSIAAQQQAGDGDDLAVEPEHVKGEDDAVEQSASHADPLVSKRMRSASFSRLSALRRRQLRPKSLKISTASSCRTSSAPDASCPASTSFPISGTTSTS